MKLGKITDRRENAGRRRYDDACGTAHALELLGERWALLVVRELMLGPKRFNDLKADLPGISANVLTQRLEGLEEAGVLSRHKLPPPASAVSVYELTPWGYEAGPILEVTGRWAARSPRHDPTLPISAVSVMLSFRTMFSPERATGFSARIGFRLGRESFLAEVRDGRFSVGSADDLSGADAIFTGAPAALAAAVYGGQDLDALAGAGALSVEGDRAAAERFCTLFVLPPKAG